MMLRRLTLAPVVSPALMSGLDSATYDESQNDGGGRCSGVESAGRHRSRGTQADRPAARRRSARRSGEPARRRNYPFPRLPAPGEQFPEDLHGGLASPWHADGGAQGAPDADGAGG